jgi:quercetin dioxygenase-like cupin family protein
MDGPRTERDDEGRVLQALDGAVRKGAVQARIAEAAARLERRLAEDPGAPMAWETLPMDLFEDPLPGGVRSAWVFALRAGRRTEPERHPNSRQRTTRFRGQGDLQVRSGGGWRSHSLAAPPPAPAAARWVSIPANAWHRVVAGPEHWIVVSFHTAEAAELIEEHPGDGAGEARGRTYLEEAAS